MTSQHLINKSSKGLEFAQLHDIHDAIETNASFADDFIGLTGDDEFIVIITERDLNVLEKIEAVEIAQGVTPTELEIAKFVRLFQVDTKTQRLISAGFTHNGMSFSLSPNAQMNWNALLTLHNAGVLSYPHRITRNDDLYYHIQDAQELLQFIGGAMMGVEMHLESGRDLKAQIIAATTIDEVNAITDNR